MDYLALNIKYLRKQKNLSQTDIEKQFGLKRGVLSSYETNRNTPPIQLLIELSDFFQVSIDDLISVDLSKSANFVKEPRQRYLTKQELYNIHELVYVVQDLRQKMDALERIVDKLKQSIKDQ